MHPVTAEADDLCVDLPVVVIGAGPIGLAAAAHLVERGEPFVVLEAGTSAATGVRAWSHVRLFTPWRYTVDSVAISLLGEQGWEMPSEELYPTGRELVDVYLDPLSRHPLLAPHIRYRHRVVAIAREAIGKLEEDRDDHPFLVEATTPFGSVTLQARAIIDASGSWEHPNPLGSNGLVVPGERAARARIRYRIPDVLRRDRGRYANRRTLVVGSGHSALNALHDLVTLKREAPMTRIVWAIRRVTPGDALNACDGDGLTERTLLKRDVAAMVGNDQIESHTGIRITRLDQDAAGVTAFSGDRALPAVDEIIAATGFRPDLSIARELRLDIHSVFESTYALAPLIDPDANACGTVPPHGVMQLAHPEPDFYIVGMKSYGRAPTFLMLTGYEHVRSVVCALTGDEDALTVKLELPEKGLCAACTAYLEEREGMLACSCGANEETGEADHPCCDPVTEDAGHPSPALVSTH